MTITRKIMNTYANLSYAPFLPRSSFYKQLTRKKRTLTDRSPTSPQRSRRLLLGMSYSPTVTSLS